MQKKPIETRTCRACGCTKPLSAYYLVSGWKEGYDRHRKECRACVADRARQSREVRGTPVERRTGRKRCQVCGEAVPLEHFAPRKWAGRHERAECPRCRAAGHERHAGERAAGEAAAAPAAVELQRRRDRTDLGIAIAHATCPPGERRTLQEIAAFAGVSRQAIRLIEQEALRRVREQVEGVLMEAGVTLAELWEVFA